MPRLGFIGVGWIGRHRMEALVRARAAAVVAISDPDEQAVTRARVFAPEAEVVPDLEAMLGMELDGIVIATPSALHADQSIAALERGLAVFCQKPLARTAEETRRVLDAARANNRRLGVDMSYRHTRALGAVRELVRSGELGSVYAADLVFHNAYGPDKPWFHDPRRSGGGCVIDLGIHLVDAALWILDFPDILRVEAHRFSHGRPLGPSDDVVEDYAVAQIVYAGGVARLACSWNLPAGCDAVIEARFHGTAGGATMRNVGGSFYDFVAERHRGTATERLVDPPDAWGGGAILAWARKLALSADFDPAVDRLHEAARVVDAIQGR